MARQLYSSRRFPNLANIALKPHCVIATNREGITRDLKFGRNMHDCEINLLLDLYDRLQQINVNSQAADRLKWGNHGGGNCTVKDGYQLMCSRNSIIDSWA